MNALLHPINRATEGIRWGLVAHTAAMFAFVTIYTALNLQIQSISYIDNRNFPGTDGTPWPGPIGYEFFIYYKAISIVPSVAFQMNTWLADGILVSSLFNSVAQVSNVGHSSSSIVAISLGQGTTGLLSFPS